MFSNEFDSIAKRTLTILVCLAVLSTMALAADKAVVTITIPSGCRTPVAVESNGSAVGTIQILYTYLGTTFPSGAFGCFDLSMQVETDTGSKTPGYPATLTVGQIGGESVVLSPASVTLTANGVGAPVTGSPVRYEVAIDPSVQTTPGLNDDGDTIVGNLRIVSNDNWLRTVPNILVKIKLIHPSVTNCLKTYHEILHKDTFENVPSIEVLIQQGGGPNAGKVNNSNPPGILDSVLVANTCTENHSFDLQLTPSSYFEIQTAAQGNSIFVYSAAGEQGFPYFASASGTGKGTNYCLVNLVVPSNSTLLTTAALKIRDKNSAPPLSKSNLPNSGNCSLWTDGCVFDFSASLHTAGFACTGVLLPSPPVSTNPVYDSIDFTTR